MPGWVLNTIVLQLVRVMNLGPLNCDVTCCNYLFYTMITAVIEQCVIHCSTKSHLLCLKQRLYISYPGFNSNTAFF